MVFSNNRNARTLVVIVGLLSLFYIGFYFVFYIFLGSLSVDALIGISIVFMFCVIYKLAGIIINRYLLSISKSVWLYFANLISLTYLIQRLFIKTVGFYKRLRVFQFACNYFVFFELGKVFDQLNVLLLSRYVNNAILSELFFKRLVIKNLNEKNVVLNESVIFCTVFLSTNIYLYNSSIRGWFIE